MDGWIKYLKIKKKTCNEKPVCDKLNACMLPFEAAVYGCILDCIIHIVSSNPIVKTKSFKKKMNLRFGMSTSYSQIQFNSSISVEI